jgi:integrase
MLWLAENGRSNHLIDKALQAVRVAVREGIRRDELLHDPTKAIEALVFHYQEKGVLKPYEARLLVEKLTERDMKLALLLGLCGMRMGEVRGLRYEDVRGDTINIQNNYVDDEGDKAPKCHSSRMVFLPEHIQQDLASGTGYVFPNRSKKGKPACTGYFRNLFIKALELIGITEEEQKKRFLSFHSLRHTFVTLGRSAGIPDMMIQALAGHKSAAMMNHYSHGAQIIDIGEAREKYKMAIGL